VDVGDSWRVTVGAVTIHAVALDAEPTAPPSLLATSLIVQNMATQPRSFPTYRLHMLSASGVAFQDTWCRDVDQSLELAPELPPDGTATGALCWKFPSADTAQVVLAWDPAFGSASEQRVAFALYPVISAESRIVPAPTPSSAPLLGGIGNATDRGQAGVSEPAGAQCSRAYSLYASSSGSHSTLACATSSNGGGGSSGTAFLGGERLHASCTPRGPSPRVPSSTRAREAPRPSAPRRAVAPSGMRVSAPASSTLRPASPTAAPLPWGPGPP